MAKFSRPRRAAFIARERLFRRLDELLEQGAVWVSGVAGAGKTSLIAGYLESRKLPDLWINVDQADSDPLLSLHYLRSAAERLVPLAGADLPICGPEGMAKPTALCRLFFRSLYRHLPDSTVVVFDNAHCALAADDFATLLEAAIDEAPTTIHVIIASRSRPSQHFARLRANGELSVVDPNELLFTEDESIAVQREWAAGGATPSPAVMCRRQRITGGWIAGLRLLAELDHIDSLAAAEKDQRASSALFDYLAAEVFARQGEGIRRFLLQVAHLPRMTPATASTLAGSLDAARILDTLHRENLFTSAYGTGDDLHYEFHPLLRQFLLVRAQRELSVDERAHLERRAAALLGESGDLGAAATLLISGSHWDELQRLILDSAPALLARGGQRTLANWLDSLPAERAASDPWLAYWRGATLLPYDPSNGEKWLVSAYRQFRESQLAEGAFLSWSAIVELICLQWADFSPLDYWLDEVQSLRAAFGDPAESVSGRFIGSLFAALLHRRPQDPAIDDWAERLLALIECCSDARERILLGCNLQIYYTVVVGRNAAIERLMAALDPPGSQVLCPFAEALRCGLRAMQHWSRGQGREAALAAENGSRLAEENGVRVWDFLLGALQTYGWLNDGNLVRARAALGELGKCLQPQRKIDLAHFHYLVCLTNLLAEEGAPALQHIEMANAIACDYGGPHQHALGAFAEAQALHTLQRTDEAWPILAYGREIAVALRSPILCFQADLCAAFFALERGDEERCARALHSAFAIGSRQGYLNHNSFRPAVMARLCAFALTHAIEPDYARRLIRLRALSPPCIELDEWPWPVKIYTLGRFSLVVGGQTVSTAEHLQRRPLDLLQALITAPTREVAIPALIKILSLDPKSRGSRGAFYAVLLRLRRLLGHDDAVRNEGGKVSLNDKLCWVDLWPFERLLSQTEHDLLRPVQDEAADLLAQADLLLRFYHGDLLAREDTGQWLLARRERLRSRLCAVLAEVGNRLEASERWRDAVRLYRRAIDLDPLVEGQYRRLMVCLHSIGETGEALHVYRCCRERLMTGLHAVPSRQTEEIRQRLARLPPSDCCEATREDA